jgi:hypothetical protein
VYLHFWAEGPEEQIAIRMHQALTLTGTPLQKDTSEKEASSIDALPAERIQALLGRKGTVKDGVLSVAVPRSQPIRMHDVELPPSIGMATAINIQAGQNGKIAATGDFVLMATEVPAVAAALIRNGIQVTALHNHLVHGSPDLYFVHFLGARCRRNGDQRTQGQPRCGEGSAMNTSYYRHVNYHTIVLVGMCVGMVAWGADDIHSIANLELIWRALDDRNYT